ncbi:hypothetical protein RB599_010693 [Gaeumannomyces hyphopodioides]
MCRSGLAGLSINHTGFSPLLQDPIAVSIETKRVGGSVQDAETQLGVWQAAQWNMLDTLAGQRGVMPPPAVDPKAAKLPVSINGLDFLPATYIAGHEWKFASTTRSASADKATNLWTECTVGSTNSILGIYKIVWCLRRLARYAAEEYWPWFTCNILQFKPGDGGMNNSF